MRHHLSTRTRRAALGLTCAATLVGTAGAVLPGGADAAASRVGAAAAPPAVSVVWLDNLLHPVDVLDAMAGDGTVTSTVGGGEGDAALSACTGEMRLSDVVGLQAGKVFGSYRGYAGGATTRYSLTEQAADRSSVTQARRSYRRILRLVGACRHEPAGHWHYGAPHPDTSYEQGASTFMRAYDGDGTADGGIVVARSGNHVAVAEISGAGTASETRLTDLAVNLTHQLG